MDKHTPEHGGSRRNDPQLSQILEALKSIDLRLRVIESKKLDRDDNLIGIATIRAMWNVSGTTIWRAIKVRGFPPPKYIGRRRVWERKDVEMWLNREARPTSIYNLRPGFQKRIAEGGAL